MVSGCPSWACSDVFQPPSTPAGRTALAAFAGAATARYGNGGCFWSSHPTVPATPVTHWQVWNEVNEERNLKSGDPAEYLQLLRTVRAADQGPGPAGPDRPLGPGREGHAEVAQRVPAALLQARPERQERVRRHGRARLLGGSRGLLRDPRRDAPDHGRTTATATSDCGSPRLGWGTEGPQHPFSPGTELQAAFLRQAFDTAIGCRTRWKLDRIFWFSLHNGDPVQQNQPDYWGFHNGLRYANGQDKPAMTNFLDYLGSKDLPGPRRFAAGCRAATRSPTPPRTSSIRSRPSTTTRRRSRSSSTRSPGFRYVCYFDIQPATDCTNGYTTPSDLVEGIYKLVVKVLDSNGNIVSSSVFGSCST